MVYTALVYISGDFNSITNLNNTADEETKDEAKVALLNVNNMNEKKVNSMSKTLILTHQHYELMNHETFHNFHIIRKACHCNNLGTVLFNKTIT